MTENTKMEVSCPHIHGLLNKKELSPRQGYVYLINHHQYGSARIKDYEVEVRISDKDDLSTLSESFLSCFSVWGTFIHGRSTEFVLLAKQHLNLWGYNGC
jgi:hypothetical protein